MRNGKAHFLAYRVICGAQERVHLLGSPTVLSQGRMSRFASPCGVKHHLCVGLVLLDLFRHRAHAVIKERGVGGGSFRLLLDHYVIEFCSTLKHRLDLLTHRVGG